MRPSCYTPSQLVLDSVAAWILCERTLVSTNISFVDFGTVMCGTSIYLGNPYHAEKRDQGWPTRREPRQFRCPILHESVRNFFILCLVLACKGLAEE